MSPLAPPAAPPGLDTVLITAELARRPARSRDLAAENTALHHLARALATGEDRLLETLAGAALALCRVGTAGVSLPDSGAGVYRWAALAGALAGYQGATTSLRHSPCGVTQGLGSPQLFDRPGRIFPELAVADPPIVEGLVVPFDPADPTLGTIWILTHEPTRRLDAEDARVLTTLAAVAATGLRLSRLAEERRRSLERHDVLLATIAHDLRNPLTAIVGYAQMARRHLARGPRAEDTPLVRALDRIDEATVQMVGQLDELSDAAQLHDGGDLALRLAPVDLVALARQFAAGYADREGAAPIVVNAAEEPIVGRFDEARVGRVIDNLLSNAVKYSPADRPIVVAVARAGDRATLAVRDRGIGIPDADLPHLFKRYHRGGNADGQASGTGLGLAGARQIVEAHGGTVVVASVEGAGTTVTVTLPLAAGGGVAR